MLSPRFVSPNLSYLLVHEVQLQVRVAVDIFLVCTQSVSRRSRFILVKIRSTHSLFPYEWTHERRRSRRKLNIISEKSINLRFPPIETGPMNELL